MINKDSTSSSRSEVTSTLAENAPSLIKRNVLKIPFVRRYKQHYKPSWSTRKILSRATKEERRHRVWYLKNYATIRKYGLHRIKSYGELDFTKLSTRELLSLAKHEGHRIEKAFYAGYMKTAKSSVYHESYENIEMALSILKERGEFVGQKDIVWLQQIHDSFHEFETFSEGKDYPVPVFDRGKLTDYIAMACERRSTRTWADPNLPKEELFEIAKALVDAAKWSPCSGNRQPWYFRILIDQDQKNLLRGIKEEHCINAPLVIFVGINKTSYGAIGNQEHGIHVDGGVAAMQMVMAAHQAGLGSCWNHFCKDFVYSRSKNLGIFNSFYKKMNIPQEIEPIALLAFGIPGFVSPPPQRPPFEAICPDKPVA